MEIASFETSNEMDRVSEMCVSHKDKLTQYVHVGGMAIYEGSTSDWYWVNSGQIISYISSRWHPGEPNGQNYRQYAQFCLSLGQQNYRFVDIDCHTHYDSKFICQKTKDQEDSQSGFSSSNPQ